MRRILVFVVGAGALTLGATAAAAGPPPFTFQRSPDSGPAGTAITVSADRCDQPVAGAGLVGNPGGVVPVQAETAPLPDGTWSVSLVLPQGIDPTLDYIVVARCGNPDAGGFFYFPDLPFDVLPSAAPAAPAPRAPAAARVAPRVTG